MSITGLIPATLYRDGTRWYLRVNAFMPPLVVDRLSDIGWIRDRTIDCWWIDRDEYPTLPLKLRVFHGGGSY